MLEHEIADTVYQPGLLGDGQEICRRDGPPTRMAPADERLGADDSTATQADDRLELEAQLAPVDRSPQVATKLVAHGSLIRHPTTIARRVEA
jgi:hypothetical protein